MPAIKQQDLIDSVADAFQYISYYHPKDYIDALARAYEREESEIAKDAIAQILTNSRMSAEGKRPVCQDTGVAVVFVKLGMDVRWDGVTMDIDSMINEVFGALTCIQTTPCERRLFPTLRERDSTREIIRQRSFTMK